MQSQSSSFLIQELMFAYALKSTENHAVLDGSLSLLMGGSVRCCSGPGLLSISVN